MYKYLAILSLTVSISASNSVNAFDEVTVTPKEQSLIDALFNTPDYCVNYPECGAPPPEVDQMYMQEELQKQGYSKSELNNSEE